MSQLHIPASLQAAALDDLLNFASALAILIGGWLVSGYGARWTKRALDRMPNFDAMLKPLLISLVRYAVIVMTLIAVLERFGVRTTSLIAVLGAAGLAIGLALQGALSNVASGVLLLILRPFQIGEYVVVGASTIGGTVREIGLFATVLVTPDMVYVAVPNSQVFSNPITNYSREATRRLNIIVGIDYEDDIDKAQAILLDILRKDARILRTPAPIAPVNELGDSSVNLIARGYVNNADYWDVYFDTMKAIKQRFDQGGISIPFPQRVMTVRNTTAAPDPDPERKLA